MFRVKHCDVKPISWEFLPNLHNNTWTNFCYAFEIQRPISSQPSIYPIIHLHLLPKDINDNYQKNEKNKTSETENSNRGSDVWQAELWI